MNYRAYNRQLAPVSNKYRSHKLFHQTKNLLLGILMVGLIFWFNLSSFVHHFLTDKVVKDEVKTCLVSTLKQRWTENSQSGFSTFIKFRFCFILSGPA